MVKICPKCGYGGLVGKTCFRCGEKLEDIPYLELMKKKPFWAILPFISILFVILIFCIIIFKPPFFYSVEGCSIMVIVCFLLTGLGFYMQRRMRVKAAKFERFARPWWKVGMITSYIFGIVLIIMGAWQYTLFSPLLGASSAIFYSTISIVFAVPLFVYAEYLRRKLKRGRFD